MKPYEFGEVKAALGALVKEYALLSEAARSAIGKIDPSGASDGDIEEILKENE